MCWQLSVIADGLLVWLRCRTRDDEVRRMVQCGVERCPLYRTLGTVDLLLCLEQRCDGALPRGSEVEEAGSKTSSNCAAACNGQVGSMYLKCLSQSCGIPERPIFSAFCPSVCRVISPDNMEGCLQHYCPDAGDQEDEGGREDENDENIQLIPDQGRESYGEKDVGEEDEGGREDDDDESIELIPDQDRESYGKEDVGEEDEGGREDEDDESIDLIPDQGRESYGKEDVGEEDEGGNAEKRWGRVRRL